MSSTIIWRLIIVSPGKIWDTFLVSLRLLKIYICTTGLSSLGVPGVPGHTQILADQLTLFQPGGTDYAHLITTGTPGFSDLPTALTYVLPLVNIDLVKYRALEISSNQKSFLSFSFLCVFHGNCFGLATILAVPYYFLKNVGLAKVCRWLRGKWHRNR